MIKSNVLVWVSFGIGLVFIPLRAQTQEMPDQKNFVGLYAGIEWNSISGLAGVDLQRTLFSRNNFSLGAKGFYIFNYQVGNLDLVNSTSGEKVSITSIQAAACLFTGDAKKFFLVSSLGAGLRSHKLNEIKSNETIGTFEAGVGFRFRLGDKISLRWITSLNFAGDGGITCTKLSIGF